jgi:hypothetical protein
MILADIVLENGMTSVDLLCCIVLAWFLFWCVVTGWANGKR